jgi:hypothetical protein
MSGDVPTLPEGAAILMAFLLRQTITVKARQRWN